jgi:hypothetical protein
MYVKVFCKTAENKRKDTKFTEAQKQVTAFKLIWNNGLGLAEK